MDETRRVFREPWSEADGTADMDETWVHGLLIGGMGSTTTGLGLASAYAEAAGMLVEAAVASDEPWRVCYPIFYLYRHALELYFKSSLPKHRRDHNLSRLISEYDEFLRSQSRPALAAAVREDLLTLAAMDPDGQGFRYTDGRTGGFLPGEYWVPLDDLRRLVEGVLWPSRRT
jgi:hypothetical protein